MEAVREHYERRPYPPIPSPALPARGQGETLRFEHGLDLAGRPGRHAGVRVLVAGCGTFEPALVARLHPRAAEIVALDLSARALGRLGRRLAMLRVAEGVRLRRLPPVRRVRADLARLDEADVGRFDYVVATGVLHHHERPVHLLARLAAVLRPGGLLRIATYPPHSRAWLRWTARWLRLAQLDPARPGLARSARRRVRELPPSHPLRVSFEANPEVSTDTGVADAYFHPVERPLSFDRWGRAAARLGLRLVGESQPPECRSAALDALVPELVSADPWTKLAVLDDLLELATQPVLWLVREAGPVAAPPAAPGLDPARPLELRDGVPVLSRVACRRAARDPAFRRRLLVGAILVPSAPRFELARGLLRTTARLAPTGVSATELLARLRRGTGPRRSPRDRDLPGLTLAERLREEDLDLPEPPREADVRLLLSAEVDAAVARAAARRLEEAQCREGAVRSWLGPLRLLESGIRGGSGAGSRACRAGSGS